MKNKRRWLAGLLAVVLVINLFVGSTWADEKNGTSADVAGVEQQEKTVSETDGNSTEENTVNSNDTDSVESDQYKDKENEVAQSAKLNESENTSNLDSGENSDTGEDSSKNIKTQDISSPVANEENVVYVGVEHGYKGESDVMGQSPEHPYSSLSEAYNNVPENGTIYVVDSLELTEWPDTEKNVTIMGYQEKVHVPIYDGNNQLTGYEDKTYSPVLHMNGNWVLHGDTILCNLTIQIAKAPANTVYAIFPEGHRLQIGTGNTDGTSAQQKRAVPRVTDTFIEPYSTAITDKEGFLNIATEPYGEVVDDSITKVDIHVYGDNRYNIMSCATALGRGQNEYHTADTLTPNLQTVTIEMIGSSKSGMMQKGNHWYNGMLPQFNGQNLKTVDFTLAYMQFSSTEALFRTGHDRNAQSLRRGSFNVDYTFDHVTANNFEAIAYGETYTTGDVTVNVYDTDFRKGGQSCLTPCVFGMQARKITVNLYDTTLSRTGVIWNATFERNNNLSFDSMSYNLYGSSQITTTMIVQDNTTVSLHDTAQITSIRYSAQTTTGAADKDVLKMVCDTDMTLPGSDIPQNNCVDLTVNSGKTVTVPAGNSSLRNVTNNGTLSVSGSTVFCGDYTASDGKLNLTAGAALVIQGSVDGNTTLQCVGEMQDMMTTSVLASSGRQDCMNWNKPSDATIQETNQDGYWSLYKGEDHAVKDCVYLRYGGNDTLDGSSTKNAVGTIARAYELATKGSANKKIVLINSYRVGVEKLSSFETQTTINGQVIFTSDDGEIDFNQENEAQLISTAYTLSNNVPIAPQYGILLTNSFQFENIHFAPSIENGIYTIYCGGYSTVMGENVTMDGYASLFGGNYATSYGDEKVETTDLTVNSGQYISIYGGNAGIGSKLKSIMLTVKGCEMVPFNQGGNGKYFTDLISGGCYNPSNSINLGRTAQDCTVNLKVVAQNGNKIERLKYIVAGNVSSYLYCGSTLFFGTYNLEVQGVNVEAIAGGDYNTRPTKSGSTLSQYSTNMIIGTETPVSAQNIYGGSMGYTDGRSWNQEEDDARLKNLQMKFGDVQITQRLYGSDMFGTVSGHEMTDLTISSGKSVEITGSVTEFKTVKVDSDATLSLSGTELKAQNVTNAGKINSNAAEMKLTGNYVAEKGACIQMGPASTLRIAGTVTGNTSVSGQPKKSFYVYATTEQVKNQDVENSFSGSNVTYDTEDTLSKWYFDPFDNANRVFVYLDGTNGDDTYNGQSPEKGETVTGDDGQTYTEGPVKSLEHAYELLKKDGGSIILCGDTTITQWPNNSNKKALLTTDASLVPEAYNTSSYLNTAKLIFEPDVNDGQFMVLQGDLTLQRILINYSFNTGNVLGGIDANGHSLTVGEDTNNSNVSFINKSTGAVSDRNFIITGGGTVNTQIPQIDLKLYNVNIGTLAVIYGGRTESIPTTVKGDINVTVKNCKYSSGGTQFFCTNENRSNSNTGNSNMCYAVTKGNVILQAEGTEVPPFQFIGFQNVTNDGKLDIVYNNNSSSARTFQFSNAGHTQFPIFDKETNITFKGNYTISELNLANVNNWMGENSDVTLNFLGDITLNGTKTGYTKGNSGVNLTINLGSPDHTYSIKGDLNRSLFPDTNQSFKSITVNCYGEKITVPLTTNGTLCQDGSKPVVNYYPAKDSSYEWEADACKLWKNVSVVLNDGVTIAQTEEEESLPFNLRLKNGGKFKYPYDSMKLDGDLQIEGEDSSLNTDGAYEIKGDVTLENKASLRAETEVAVGGQFTAKDSNLILAPGSNTVLNSIAEDIVCNVQYDGTLAESESHGGAQIESETDASSERFSDAITTDKKTIPKVFENNIWTYGDKAITNEIYLKSAGDDENDGTTSGKSVKTLKQALELVAKHAEAEDGRKNQTIVLCGRYQFDNTEANQIGQELLNRLENVQVTVTQQSETGTRYRGTISVQTGFEIPCSLTFEKCTLCFVADGQNYPEFYAHGYHLIIDEGVEVKSDGKMPALYGGSNENDCESTQLDVSAGTWYRIYGGGKNGNVTGNTIVNLGDAQKKIAPIVSTGTEDDNYTGETYAVFGGGDTGNVGGNTTVNLYTGDQYNYIFGGSVNGTVAGDTKIECVNDVTAARLYGGSVTGQVSGMARVNVYYGNFQRIYGAGVMEKSSVGHTDVVIGNGTVGASDAIVSRYVRGSGDRGKVNGNAVLTIQNGAVIPKNCSFAAGGYMGGASKSVLNVNGGSIACNVFAGGFGEYKTGSATEINKEVGYVSSSELNINSGTITGNIFAGGNMGYVGNGTHTDEVISSVNITGGTVTGNIYGGCNVATTYGNTELTLSGGSITGNIFGGGKGTDSIQAEITGNTTINVDSEGVRGNIYGGCDTNGSVNTTKINATVLPGCNLFGGGYGEKTTVTKESDVSLNASDSVQKKAAFSVYGGGEKGRVQKTNVTVQNWSGNIFGGGKGELKAQNKIARAFLRVFTRSDLIDANVPSTNVVINGTVTGDVFGGGEYATVGKSGVDTSTDNTDLSTVVSKVTVNGTVNGTVYGGGKGEEGKDYAAINGSTLVTLGTNGNVTVAGNAENAATGVVFGGGQNAPVAGNTNVNVTAGTYSTIFGGNDVSGEIQGTTKVSVTGGTTEHVYGAGRDAAYTGDGASVTVEAADASQNASDADSSDANTSESNESDTNSTGSDSSATVSAVYGGGYGSGATTEHANVSIQDGNVTTAYAGGNAAPTKDTDISVTGGNIETVFGGGNAATVTGTSTVTVNTADDIQHVDTVFAGNNKAAMSIKPTLEFADGRIGTVYCGGNQGIMNYRSDSNQGLEYTFDYPEAEIGTVYAGCNNTTDQTADVALTLASGTYDTVYGGNNRNGNMQQTHVVINASADSGKSLQVGTIYGGGNQAEAVNTAVTMKQGTIPTIYGGGNQANTQNTAVSVEDGTVNTLFGGGNAATVTGTVKIATGATVQGTDRKDGQNTGNSTSYAEITDLYCGNNEAEMEIAPQVDLKSAHIINFYGGGNKGVMKSADGLNYTFDADDLTIDTIYGGGNQAGVTEAVTLNVANGTYTTIYGGSNSDGIVNTANMHVLGDVGTASSSGSGNTALTGSVFGGGRGQATTVNTTNVFLENGTIAGNVYGGSGFGKVGSANVTAKEAENSASTGTMGTNSDAVVKILGNVFGAGYGVSSSVDKTNVNVDLKLKIVKDDASDGDVKVREQLKSSEDTSGESQATATWLNGKKYTDGSYIAGNVYGGGDMGQVGKGYINVSTNTAVIEQDGTTYVNVAGGYIHGNVFGGGNGQPGGTDESGNPITEYTVYMGTVFGTSHVTMTGGYVNGNLFGCGQQSRTYAAEDETDDGANDASVVTVSTASDASDNAVLIGGSIFGGGNKGNGTTQNASVATTYGDTHVTLRSKAGQYTPIYLLSNGTTGGGVYGDGNLCLVSGKKYVTLEHFSCGLGDQANMLKTFYSLQRADVVDLTGSRIVLKGAVDLVAENADDTMYSINRVGQLNLKQSSTIKVTRTVKLLGELTSDEQQNRQFIDRGNNDGNSIGNNTTTANGYTASGGAKPEDPLTDAEVKNYISAYDQYIAGMTMASMPSINVVCVANGGYLEIKKSAEEYGPVTGLFTLQLVNANPGEGGGFVYADIMGKKVSASGDADRYVTGNFICVTKQKQADNSDYMYAYHNVGGQLGSDGRYEYYVWYLKGNKYNYDVDLTAYIGTKDTDFSKTVSLALEPNQSFVLTGLTQNKDVSGLDLEKMYQNTWNATTDASDEKIAVEVTLITNKKEQSGITTTEEQLGYLGYQTTSATDPKADPQETDGKLVWGIWRNAGNGGWKFQACANADENNSFQVTTGDALASIGEDVVNAQLKITLHKGTGMTTEFRNLPFEMKIAEVKQETYDQVIRGQLSHVEDDACIRLTTNLNLSAIRLVPTQAAYMGSGRMFAGVSSSSTVNITDTSAFTAQFVTKYVPSAFNTGSRNQITETLTTAYSNTYLLDSEGVGYTIQEDKNGAITILNLTNNSDPDVSNYRITKKNDGSYQVTYQDASGHTMKDTDGKERIYSCEVKIQNSGFTLPKGTVVTLLASLDEGNPTYWYYYCTENTTEIPLDQFTKMNTVNSNSGAGQTNAPSGNKDTVYSTISTTSSSRVTENMIFVFDFANVDAAAWETVSAQAAELSGTVMLKHTYTSGRYTADIMDYVSSDSVTENDQTTVTYSREMPKSTEEFKISTTTDGISKFEVSNAGGQEHPTYGQKEKMTFHLNITPDTNVTNTQYEEREYAVILTLQKKADDAETGSAETWTDVPFPEGTIFTYKGEKLSVGTGNKYVIVPVQTVGNHEVEIMGQLAGFDPEEYQLTAKLYATSEVGYYNSLPINHRDDRTTAHFSVSADPAYALQVNETSNSTSDTSDKKRVKNHLLTGGDTLHFSVTAKREAGTGTPDDTDDSPVSLRLYQYEKAVKAYKAVALDQVFSTDVSTLEAGTDRRWTPAIAENAAKGTYRLEFRYHDKVEYWDFIVSEANKK